ncbi:MAG: ROK family protein [Ignavibacteriaceae bacterium]
MKKESIVCGIDIGGTNTVIGFITRNGNCIKEISLPTNSGLTPNEYFKNISGLIQETLSTISSNFNLVGIGIGAPNANYQKKTIENPPNLNWGIVDVSKTMKKYFDLPITIINDANAAAIGELHFGAGKGMENFILITLGTGLGGGIVVNGEIVNGRNGIAGEIGHIICEEGGRQCKCGLKGCLETYVSATGIVTTAKELLNNSNLPSVLRKINSSSIDSKLIFEAALDDDLLALNAFELTGKALGTQLAVIVSIINPEAIFLLGGLAGAGELIIEPTKKYMEKNLFTPYKNKVKILPSGLNNVNAAVLGAGALIWNELESLENVFVEN